LYLNSNGLTEFDGTDLSSLTSLDLQSNQLTEFDGTGLTSLTELYLNSNGLTEFDGTDLSSLIKLDLGNNPLTTFIGGDMGLISELDFPKWSITTLTSFDGTGLSGLTDLSLTNNGLTSLDVLPMTSLINLYLTDPYGLNGNPMTATANNTILSGLVTNGLTDGSFYTSGGRTADGTADYDTLIANNWNILGADLIAAVRKLRVRGIGQQNQ
jgi:hypothetical protein